MSQTMEEMRKQLMEAEFRRKHGIRPPEDDRLARHVKARRALHEGKRSHRPLSRSYEKIGLAGEAAFGRWAGIELDLSLRPRGTRAINYKRAGRKINVLTARKPTYLLVEKGKTRADIYVLAAYRDHSGDAVLLGWADKETVKNAPVWDPGGKGIESHVIHHTDLRPMEELAELLGMSRPKPVALPMPW